MNVWWLLGGFHVLMECNYSNESCLVECMIICATWVSLGRVYTEWGEGHPGISTPPESIHYTHVVFMQSSSCT